MTLSRRRFLKAAAGVTAGGLAISTGYLVANDEANQPVVSPVQIPIKNLAPALEGFTVVLLSDFHLYPFTQLALVQRAIAIANSLKPNLIVLTGDYVWRDVEAIFDLAPELAKLDAQYGVYAIMGNHDLWTDVTVVQQGFDEVRLPVLVNEGLTLTIGKARLNLVGLDDAWSGQPDLNQAMANLPAGLPTILLMHEPDLADTYAQDGRISLQLSGHSHGGQIRLPLVGPLILPYLGRKYDLGLYQVNDMWLYTNGGLGVTSEPIRFNCPPEITRLTLVNVNTP